MGNPISKIGRRLYAFPPEKLRQPIVAEKETSHCGESATVAFRHTHLLRRGGGSKLEADAGVTNVASNLFSFEPRLLCLRENDGVKVQVE